MCDRCKVNKKTTCYFCSVAKNPYLKKYKVDDKETAFCHISCVEKEHINDNITLTSNDSFITKFNNFSLMKKSIIKQMNSSDYISEDKAFPPDLIKILSSAKTFSNKILLTRFSFNEFFYLILDLIEMNKAYKNGNILLYHFFPEKYLKSKTIKGDNLVLYLKVIYEEIDSKDKINFKEFSYLKKSSYLERNQILELS